MARRTADVWLDLFKVTERDLEITVVAMRGTTVSAKDKQKAIRRLDQCGENIKQLTHLLQKLGDEPLQPVGMGELQRRRGLLANLRGFLENARGLTSPGHSALRNNFFEASEEMSSTRSQESVELFSANERKSEEQDETLDIIDDGLQKLKAMSHDLNSELDLHINLLQDLDESVEVSNRRMLSTARRVEQFSGDGSENNCCTIVTMTALCGLIILLALTNLVCLVKPCR